ncbi:O-antigen ligase family protein [Akkermansiaceae bacterium]|nr:O-antigen ligase family protein [Akkermansiaceae bacterium]
MRRKILKYIFPGYLGIIFLDLNEYVTRFIGTEGVLSSLILVVSLVLIAIGPLGGNVGRLNKSFLILFLGFISLGALASALEGTYNGLFSTIRYYSSSLLIFLATIQVIRCTRKKSGITRIIKIIAFLLGINSLIIIGSITFGLDFHAGSNTVEIERAVGLYSNANKAGYVSVIGQILALLLFLSKRTKNVAFYFSLYLVCLFAAVVTFSKGAILVSLLLLGRIMLGSNKVSWQGKGVVSKSFIRGFVVVFSAVTAALILILLYKSDFSVRQNDRLENLTLILKGEFSDTTTTNRTSLVFFALEEMRDSWFSGAGLGEFHRMENGYGTHNMYLLVLGEAGLFGLILYLYYLFVWAKISIGGDRFGDISFALGNLLILFIFMGFTTHTLLANKQMIVMLAVLFTGFRNHELTAKTKRVTSRFPDSRAGSKLARKARVTPERNS